MPNISDLPIDWAHVNWLYVIVLSVIVFFSTLLCTLAFRGAVMSALVFAAAFVFYTYYPHGLPLPTWSPPKRQLQQVQPLRRRARSRHSHFARRPLNRDERISQKFCEVRFYKNFAIAQATSSAIMRSSEC